MGPGTIALRPVNFFRDENVQLICGCGPNILVGSVGLLWNVTGAGVEMVNKIALLWQLYGINEPTQSDRSDLEERIQSHQKNYEDHVELCKIFISCLKPFSGPREAFDRYTIFHQRNT